MLKTIMEFLFTPGGVGTLLLAAVAAYIKRGTWIPWVKGKLGAAIPGDSEWEKLLLDKGADAVAQLLAGGQVDAVIDALLSYLKAQGMSESEAQAVAISDVPLALLKIKYEAAKSQAAAKFGKAVA